MTISNEYKSDQLKIFSKHYSSIIKILYINKFDKSSKEIGYSLLPYQISDI